MCNCIAGIEWQVKSEHNAFRAYVYPKGWSVITYTLIRKDGEPARHNRYERIDWKFCPFCGEEKK